MKEIELQRHPETNEIIPEIWKDIDGYDGWYQVSNYGRVRSYYAKGRFKKIRTTPTIKEQQDDTRGYSFVRLYKEGVGENKKIHRLVAEHFIPNNDPKKPLVLHKNDNKKKNEVDNLYWGNHSDNERDKGKNGIRINKGQQHGMSKLSKKDVRQIKKMIRDDERFVDIAQKFPISPQTVGDIANGRSWTHV